MSQHEDRDTKLGVNEGRRKLIRAAAVAGGAAVAVAALPGEWKKPLATVGGLPAHAQTSDAPIVLGVFSYTPPTPDALPDTGRNGLPLPPARFDYTDPLCQVDLDVTIKATITGCGPVPVEFTKTLAELGAVIVGTTCTGYIYFPIALGNCCGDMAITVQVSKGIRKSNTIPGTFTIECE